MFSPTDAAKIIKENHPYGEIQSYIDYGNVYIFQVFNKHPGEEVMDPFYSVDKSTGAFAEFSILTDGPTEQITSLFEQAKRR